MNSFRLLFKLTDKIEFRRGEKSVGFSNPSIYYTWKNISSSYKNNKFKTSAPPWNDKFGLPHIIFYIRYWTFFHIF